MTYPRRKRNGRGKRARREEPAGETRRVEETVRRRARREVRVSTTPAREGRAEAEMRTISAHCKGQKDVLSTIKKEAGKKGKGRTATK